MPIYESRGSLLLHFGHGDIAIHLGRSPGKSSGDELVFTETGPHPVGSPSPAYDGKTTEEVGARVRMVFDSVASLDVLAEQLAKLRGEMIGSEDHPWTSS